MVKFMIPNLKSEYDLKFLMKDCIIITKAKGVVIYMSMINVGENLQNNDCTFEQRQADIAIMEKKENEAREREKHSPYKDFCQTNLDPNCGKARRQLIKDCPSAYIIYDFLIEKADRYNAVMCSNRVLEEALGLSQATIYRAISILQEKKFIDIKKSGTSNIYLLNKELVWKSWGTNFKYAQFGVSVVISESEQEKLVETKRMNVVNIRE